MKADIRRVGQPFQRPEPLGRCDRKLVLAALAVPGSPAILTTAPVAWGGMIAYLVCLAVVCLCLAAGVATRFP